MSASLSAALALDPGGTTGYCIARSFGKDLSLEVGESQLSKLGMYQMVRNFCRADMNRHVIYESFQYRNVARMGLDLTPVELIGVIELVNEERFGNALFYHQMASQAKTHFTDDRLKEEGVYKRGKKHGRDATRHMLYWLTFGPGAQFGPFELKLYENT